MDYYAEKYRNENGSYRWAVINGKTSTWYFPSRYGKKAAIALANQLNKMWE